jgi:hypothetical protein
MNPELGSHEFQSAPTPTDSLFYASFIDHHRSGDLSSYLHACSRDVVTQIQWHSSLGLIKGIEKRDLSHIGCIGYTVQCAREERILNDIFNNGEYAIQPGDRVIHAHFLPSGDNAKQFKPSCVLESTYIGFIDLERFLSYAEKHGDLITNQTDYKFAWTLIHSFGFRLDRIIKYDPFSSTFPVGEVKTQKLQESSPSLYPPKGIFPLAYSVYAFPSDIRAQQEQLNKHKQRAEDLLRKSLKKEGIEPEDLEKEARIRLICKNAAIIDHFCPPHVASPQ